MFVAKVFGSDLYKRHAPDARSFMHALRTSLKGKNQQSIVHTSPGLPVRICHLIYRGSALGTLKSPVDGHDGQHVRLLRCQ